MATSNHRGSSSGRPAAGSVADPDRAVEDSYEVITSRLVERLDLPAETHWEVVDAAEGAGVEGDALDALRRLTEIYEAAVYAPGTVAPADARWAIDVAARFEELVA